MQEKIHSGFSEPLNHGRNNFQKDRHAATLRLPARRLDKSAPVDGFLPVFRPKTLISEAVSQRTVKRRCPSARSHRMS